MFNCYGAIAYLATHTTQVLKCVCTYLKAVIYQFIIADGNLWQLNQLNKNG